MNATGFMQFAGALMAVLLWLAAPASANAALDPALLQRIDRFVADEVASSNIPGVALAVLNSGRLDGAAAGNEAGGGAAHQRQQRTAAR